MKIQMDLTEEEADRLHVALQNYIGDLNMEISATDLLAFREDLKVTRDLLKKLDQALCVEEMA